MWENSQYYWVVLCKNWLFHFRSNLHYRHRIPLAETDAIADLPALSERFSVRCDVCKKEYLYRPAEVLRYEQTLPGPFIPHPLFKEDADGTV